jgi:hypothetical protein
VCRLGFPRRALPVFLALRTAESIYSFRYGLTPHLGGLLPQPVTPHGVLISLRAFACCDDRRFPVGPRSPVAAACVPRTASAARLRRSVIHPSGLSAHPANLQAAISRHRIRTYHRLSPRTLLECLPRPKPAHRVRRRQSPGLLACAHSFLLRRASGFLLVQPWPNRCRAGYLPARPERSLAPPWQNCLAHLVHRRLAPVIRPVVRPPGVVSYATFIAFDISPANFLPHFVLLADSTALAGFIRPISIASGTLASS